MVNIWPTLVNVCQILATLLGRAGKPAARPGERRRRGDRQGRPHVRGRPPRRGPFGPAIPTGFLVDVLIKDTSE